MYPHVQSHLHLENSTDIEHEKSGSIFFYRQKAKDKIELHI